MANQIFDYAVSHTATGLTGTNGIQFDPFNVIGYGLTQTVKMVIEIEAVALRNDEESSGVYPVAYATTVIWIFNPTGPSYGQVSNHLRYSDTNGDVTWFLISGFNGGPMLRAQGNPVPAGKTYNLCFSARIIAMVHK